MTHKNPVTWMILFNLIIIISHIIIMALEYFKEFVYRFCYKIKHSLLKRTYFCFLQNLTSLYDLKNMKCDVYFDRSVKYFIASRQYLGRGKNWR